MCKCNKNKKIKLTLYLPIIAKPSPSVYDPNPNPNATIFNNITLNNGGLGGQTSVNKLQTSTSSLFSDIELTNKIGNTSANVTIYNFENNLCDSNIDLVYRLDKGNIHVQLSEPLKNYGSFYGIPENKIIFAPIKFGTGEYLNTTGYVKIETGMNTSTKKITLYINY